MRRFSTFLRWPTRAAVLGVVCAAWGIWLLTSASGLGGLLQRASCDSCFWWFDATDNPGRHERVVIIYLDLESHLRERQDPMQPWPRALHARLLRNLTAAGAKAVVFDVVFDRPSHDPAADADLAAAIRAHGRVVLAGELSVASQRTGTGDWGRMTSVVKPLQNFRDAAAGWGLGELRVDSDFVARRSFDEFEFDYEKLPSLTRATAGVLKLPSLTAPGASANSRWLRYYGPPFTIPHVGFSQALEAASLADGMFRDAIVLIGARPMASVVAERRDEFRSPFRSWGERDLFMPGVEVHATQLLNLLRGDGLTRTSVVVELGLVFCVGVLLGAGLLRLRPMPATMAAVATGGAVLAGAMLAFRQANVWFPWMILTFGQVPLALGGAVLVRSLDWAAARRRFEAAKRADAARIREQALLIDRAGDAILTLDLEGRITYANPAAEKLYGFSQGPLKPQRGDFLNEVKVTSTTRLDSIHNLALKRGEWAGETHQKATDGREFIAESRWTLLRDESGAPRGFLVINSDVTERRQLEAEALRLQRTEAIGALASGMAHDLNNALAPILMGTQLLRREARDDETRRVLALMESSTRRGADMVRQVLLFARGRQGDFERLDIGPLVREMEKLARDTFPSSITITAHLATDLWPVRANATQLHQVLLNLCVNARDAMPEGGTLALAADNVALNATGAAAIPEAHAGEFVVLMVADSGVGMSAVVQAKIFEPFFTTKAEGRGTGLGLSTTARIVRAHGGFIAVQSQPGEGTTIEVYLPRFAEALTAKHETAVSEPPQRGHGQLILVADDDQAVRDLLRRNLEDHGYHVITAPNGAEALAQLRNTSRPVNLVISDVSMPALDGPGLMVAARRIQPTTPGLLLSATVEMANLSQEELPGVELLEKPVEVSALLETVARLIRAD